MSWRRQAQDAALVLGLIVALLTIFNESWTLSSRLLGSSLALSALILIGRRAH